MAYGALPAKGATDPFDLTAYNLTKGNFEAGVPDIMTAKGDLAVATGADAAVRLPVGADGCELIADSAEASGLIWHIKPWVRVYIDTNMAISNDTWTAIVFTAERQDSDGMWDVSDPTRLIVPAAGAGVYLIGASLQWNTSDSAYPRDHGIRIRVGSTIIAQTISAFGQQDDIALSMALVTAYQCAVADEITCQVYTHGGTTLLAQPAYSAELWAMWMRMPV
jgi:hypothetical protein